MCDDEHGSQREWTAKLGPEAYERIRSATADDIIVPRSDIEIMHPFGDSNKCSLEVPHTDLEAFVEFVNDYADVANTVGAERAATEAQSLLSDYQIKTLRSEEGET